MKSPTPAVQKAIDFVCSYLQSMASHERKLPSTAALADSAGVSLVSMSKAVAVLKERNILDCFRKQGIYRKFDPSFIDTARNKSGTVSNNDPGRIPVIWQRIKLRIQQDIFNGVYSATHWLPMQKELCRRYHVSTATLRKALNALENEDVIRHEHAGYYVPEISIRRSSAAVAAIVPSDLPNRRYFEQTISNKCIRTLEQACVKKRLRLTIISPLYINNKFSLYTPGGFHETTLPQGPDIIGYVYYAIEYYDLNEKILSMLKANNKPIGIVDPTGIMAECREMVEASHIRASVFANTTNEQSAAQVMRFLAASGHTRSIYISPLHGYYWSKKRYEHCRRFCMQSGGKFHCSLIGRNRRLTTSDFRQKANARCSPRVLEQAFAEWKSTAPPEFLVTVGQAMEWVMHTMHARAALCRICTQLFEQALENKKATAWICANDDVASFALDFLSRKGVGVPGQLSIISFDDSHIALKKRITSYNFNIEAALEAALRFVCSSHAGRQKPKVEYTTIEGFINERETTGQR
ncbi:MAG: GntR family transcriptional regulator [Chitinivibrionales bacterium]|nr:GntR family transcriptional regulator [Chitinivibrionales bacterium]